MTGPTIRPMVGNEKGDPKAARFSCVLPLLGSNQDSSDPESSAAGDGAGQTGTDRTDTGAVRDVAGREIAARGDAPHDSPHTPNGHSGSACDECGARRSAMDGYAAHRPSCSHYLPGCVYDADIGAPRARRDDGLTHAADYRTLCVCGHPAWEHSFIGRLAACGRDGCRCEDFRPSVSDGLTHIAPVVARVVGRLLTLAMAALVGGGSVLWR